MATNGTLTISAGESTGTICMPVTLSVAASDKVFHVNLGAAGAILSTSQMDVTIPTTTPESSSGGCGRGVGVTNLILFYALCWTGLVCLRRTWRA